VTESAFGVFDKKKSQMLYIGLHENEADVWEVYLGWPDKPEIVRAKERGIVVLPIEVHVPKVLLK
jgi:hypothetical protein